MNITELTLAQTHKGLKDKEFSSVELTKAYLDRIKKVNSKLNAFVSITEENALGQAANADKKIAEDNAGPLTGIPCGIKDNFCEKGVDTTACSNILKGFKPPYDATSVAKLRDAGAIFLGHTNTDEFTMGSSTETSNFGVTKNPWDETRVAGGSSGGSTAAVSADLCVFATGSDTGGSIRQPAALCGCTGLKVTYGRVSRNGVMSMASSLDTVGAIAKNCEDLSHVLQVLAGKDSEDSTTPDVKVDNYVEGLNKPIKGMKIGIPKEYFTEGIQPEIDQAIRETLKVFENLGAETKEISLPHTKYAIPAYYVIAPSEISANMSRYDGVRYGPAAEEAKSLQEFYAKNRSHGFGDEVKRRVMIGTYALSAGYYDAYYLKAQKVRTLISKDFEDAFKKIDLIVAPVTPTTAFGIGENVEDPLQMYLADILTVAPSLAGICGLSVPCGFDKKNLPIGLQIVGPQFGESLVLRAGHAYQKETDWHTKKPPVK
jgi:aspartyl-tRNA(Asn)/glutamyl-tRNA(Gln) amidotransferase subunit A